MNGTSLFQRDYYCLNITQSNHLTKLEKLKYEASDKILIPMDALEALTKKVKSNIFTLRLTNKEKHKLCYVGIGNFVQCPTETIWLPEWIMKLLEINNGDKITANSTILKKGTEVKFKVPNGMYDTGSIIDFVVQSHVILFKGKKLYTKMFEKVYEIEVSEVKPDDAVCIIDTDLKYDFEMV
jgi:hypothetical protein